MRKRIGIIVFLLVFGVAFLYYGWSAFQISLRVDERVVECEASTALIKNQLGYTGGRTFDCGIYRDLSRVEQRQAIQFMMFGSVLIVFGIIFLFWKK